MLNVIGNSAGIIWNYLDKNGETSVSKMVKETKLDAKVAQRALGWLACENKVNIETQGRNEIISLK